MKPKNLAIGVVAIFVIAAAVHFLNKDNSAPSGEKEEVKGRELVSEDKVSEIVQKTHRIVITSEKSLFLGDDDKFRTDLGNYTLAEDAEKDDKVVVKAGTALDSETVAKLKEEDVSNVEVSESLTLIRGDLGWVVESFQGLPSEDPFDIDEGSFFSQLKEAQIVRTAGKNSERVRKKHEADKTKISFQDESGSELLTLYTGRRHDEGGRFAIVEGETYAYHVAPDDDDTRLQNTMWLSLDSDNEDWAEQNLLEHLGEDDEIEKVELTYPTLPPVIEKITFTRKDGKWSTEHQVPGKDFDESKVTDLVDDITDVRWMDAWKVDSENVTAAKGHYRKLLVHTKSKGTYQIQVGRSPAPEKEEKEEEKTDDAEKTDDKEEEEDEPEPGPVVTFIESLDVSSPLFKLSDKTAFDAGESLYNAIPDTLAGFFKDPPPPPPPPPTAVSGTGGVSVSGGAKTTTTPKKPKISVATPPIAVPPPPSAPPSTPPPTITPPQPPKTQPPADPEAK